MCNLACTIHIQYSTVAEKASVLYYHKCPVWEACLHGSAEWLVVQRLCTVRCCNCNGGTKERSTMFRIKVWCWSHTRLIWTTSVSWQY